MTDLEQALKGQSPYRATYRWVRPDNNEVRWLHCRASLITRYPQPLFEGAIIDLTAEFTGSIGRLAGPDSVASVLAAFPSMVFTIDAELRILRVNKSDEQFVFNFGDTQFNQNAFKVGRPILQSLVQPEQRHFYEQLFQQMLSGKQNYFRNRLTIGTSIYNLEITPINETGRVAGLLFIVSDVSEIVSLERQLAELHKSEGLRLLAAGVAHNFNNALQGILGQASAIINHSENKEIVQKAAQTIIDTVNKASELSRQLVVYDDSSTRNLKKIDPNLIVMSAVSAVDNLFTSGLKIAVTFGTPPLVNANQQLLAEAIKALIINAIESMPQGGSLEIKTFKADLHNLEIQDLPAGKYAKICVVDSGRGMPLEIKSRCCEPFFTTKDPQAINGVSILGKGLGLSKASSIFREYGGGLTIDNAKTQGSIFSIYLPAANDEAQANKVSHESSLAQAEILVLDDDPAVLKSIEMMLTDLNYKTIVTEDPKRALAICRIAGKSLKLVLVDALMPNMDGATFIRKLVRTNKSIKIIGFSGAGTNTTDLLLKAGATAILSKPIGPDGLRMAINSYLRSTEKLLSP